jgi:hypothetical protein
MKQQRFEIPALTTTDQCFICLFFRSLWFRPALTKVFPRRFDVCWSQEEEHTTAFFEDQSNTREKFTAYLQHLRPENCSWAPVVAFFWYICEF